MESILKEYIDYFIQQCYNAGHTIKIYNDIQSIRWTVTHQSDIPSDRKNVYISQQIYNDSDAIEIIKNFRLYIPWWQDYSYY